MCCWKRHKQSDVPIAWAVVEKENNDTWGWFYDILFRDLSVGPGEDWVFTSDQQKV
jgi:hypothetical protein